jgi:hypothetical protein
MGEALLRAPAQVRSLRVGWLVDAELGDRGLPRASVITRATQLAVIAATRCSLRSPMAVPLAIVAQTPFIFAST